MEKEECGDHQGKLPGPDLVTMAKALSTQNHPMNSSIPLVLTFW